MQSNNKYKSESSKKRFLINPLEKQLISTDKKISNMLEKIQLEISKLELEWLHLRALSNTNDTEINNVQENQLTDAPMETEENNVYFDDINIINASKINFETSINFTNLAQEYEESDSDESEMEENENIFI